MSALASVVRIVKVRVHSPDFLSCHDSYSPANRMSPPPASWYQIGRR
jgi:hypothetical protein